MENEPDQPLKLTIGVLFTLSRLLLLPVIIAGVALKIGWLSAGAMLAAVLSDLADGGIARLRGEWTQAGKNLDSVIDFILIHSVYIAFYASGSIPTYQFAMIYITMLMTLLVFFVHTSKGNEGLADTKFSRPTGALEYGYLLYLVAGEVVPHGRLWEQAGIVFFAALAVMALTFCFECVVVLKKTV
jgi:phosphatidylglycerophosphate synthase